MKINRLEVYALRAPAPERPHWTSHFIVPTANEILVRLYTDRSEEHTSELQSTLESRMPSSA